MNCLMLGPGRIRREGWKTLDSDPDTQPDYLAMIPPLPEAVKRVKWDEIEWIHGITSVYPWQGAAVLRELHTVIAPGGKLVLEQPDARLAAEGFLRNPELIRWIFGDPQGNDPLIMNRWAYTPESLTAALIEAGFHTIVRRPARHHYPARDFRLEAIA